VVSAPHAGSIVKADSAAQLASMIYNIPIRLLEAYRGRQLIVRSYLPWRLTLGLSEYDLKHVSFVQLLSLEAEMNGLIHWAPNLPIELVMQKPVNELPLLYRHARLLDNHPVRVLIPVVSGFSQAVKLALSLNFAVKLESVQPSAALLTELSSVLDLYLHRATVAQPVEFFHSLFLSLYNRVPASIWEIQEEDPSQVRYIKDDGTETVSPRFTNFMLEGDLSDFIPHFQHELLAAGTECTDCEFFNSCGGYFKWPNPEFSCDGVQNLLGTVRAAADELREDLQTYASAGGLRS